MRSYAGRITPSSEFARSADVFGDGTVALLEATGHTPGHAAVLVRAGEKWLIHAGDSFVHHAELEGEERLPLGVRVYRRILHEDKEHARVTLGRLRVLRRDHPEIAIVNAHDATLLRKLPPFPQAFTE